MIRHDPRVIPLRTGYHNLWGSRVERRHLAQVPDQQAPIGDDGVVPGAAVVVPFPDTTRTLYVFEPRYRATPASDVACSPRSAGQPSSHCITARPVASVAD